MLAAAMAIPFIGSAVPAIPGIIDTFQPDGTPVSLKLHGDESFSWAESLDGCTLLRDAKGYWTIAVPDNAGYASVSQIRYSGKSAVNLYPRITPGLKISASLINSARSKSAAKSGNVQVDNSFPTIGKHKLLMLLVNFADTQTTLTREDFDNYMNQQGFDGIGSFRDFYLENSYGQLDIETTVTDWITLPYDKSVYGIDNVPEILLDALSEAAKTIDLTQFDNDGDGVLDGLALIHQGPGAEATGSSQDIWSHSSIIYGVKIGGVEVGRYTVQPETIGYGSRISTVGVMCHEFGHNLGAPDFYDADYESSGGDFPGTGLFDVMGSGAWNGDKGDRPAGFNMWQKIQYGWVKPTVLTETSDVNNMPGSTFTPTAYRFNTTIPGEYFVVENRQKEGVFDQSIPSSGVLIYHANESMIADRVAPNTVNAFSPQSMYLVCASAKSDPDGSVYSYGNLNNAPYPGINGNNVFDDTSLPSTKSISGRFSYAGLHDISVGSDGKASFRYVKEIAPASPENLKAVVSKGTVTLTWDIDNESLIDSYTVYRNDKELTSVNGRSYTDDNPVESWLTYYVDAVYKDGLISPYSSVSVRVPMNNIESIGGTISEDNVVLNWNVNKQLTRLGKIDNNEGFFVVKHNTPSIDFVHRYTADDLITYRGYKVRKVSFCPYVGLQQAVYTVRVWEADQNGQNPKLISERVVKELGTGIWNSILLTKSVEITAGKELWIGVNMKPTSGTAEFLCDVNEPLHGYGNLMYTEADGWVEDPKALGNYFIAAELSQIDDTVPVPMSDISIVTNPSIELFYPMGYAVYRNGEFLGNTSSRCYIDENAPMGLLTYNVAALFKGENESNGVEFTINHTAESVKLLNTDDVIVVNVAGGIRVDNFDGYLFVSDVAGRVIFVNNNYNGETVYLNAGIYVANMDGKTYKIIVRE